ncbi:MAG: ABC transporter substrate-binding protein [Thermodesulfobacteriota bacterium]
MDQKGRLLVIFFMSLVFILAAQVMPVTLAQAQQQFTDWGWPIPYEKVSDKSVSYLKEKGWWPIKWAYQPPWMAEATIPWIIKKLDLAKKRGLEVEIVGLLSGPDINEGLASGKFAIGNGGNFPVTSLLDKKVKVKSAGIIWTPLDEHPILVHLNSSIIHPKDLEGKSVGLVAGSSAEFAFVGYAQAQGIDLSKVSLKPMPIPDQATFPAGIDAVVPWAPTPALMIKHRKNAKMFTDTGPYQLYWGDAHVRTELVENCPDVVQALVDMSVEALLWGRIHLKEATDFVKEDPYLQSYPWQLLYDENVTWMARLKPTWIYPFAEIYAEEGARVAKWLHEKDRIKNKLTKEDYMDYFAPGVQFMNNTFKKLGWNIPSAPPYFAAGTDMNKYREALAGQRFRTKWHQLRALQQSFHFPYRMEQNQAWPEKGDLEKPWTYEGKTYTP